MKTLDKVPSNAPVAEFSRAYLVYLSALAAIVGPAAPLVVAFTRALPTFNSHSAILGGLSFLLNITLVSLLMFWRHSLIKHVFRYRDDGYYQSPVVVMLIVTSLLVAGLLLALYFRTWSHTQDNLAQIMPEKDILNKATLSQLPWPELTVFYCGSFLLLQLAFSVMALKEYGQAVLGISERTLLENKARAQASHREKNHAAK
jgi:hypothetical protein